MECTCHLMRGEPCPTCNENARRQRVQDKRLDRINNCKSIVDLERLVTRFAMVFMPNSHKNILKMSWMDAAHEVMNEQPEYAQLLRAASERWEEIELDSETPDEESVVWAPGISVPTYALQVANAAQPHKDPDGPPTGNFGWLEASKATTERMAKDCIRAMRSASLSFINQPAKSLREELRMGVNYEDRPE